MSQTACGCGRSPTGFCVEWHKLDEATYQVRLAEYNLEMTKIVPPMVYDEPAPQSYTYTPPDAPSEPEPE